MFRVTKWLKKSDLPFLDSECALLKNRGFHAKIKRNHGRYAMLREVKDGERDNPEFDNFIGKE